MGLIDLHRGTTPDRAWVGYWLAPAARGRGLATRAVRLVAAWAFTDPTLERLELMTLVGNDASGRVALRAGFRREGILRRYLDFRGALLDAVMYAMVREDPADEAGEAGPGDDPLVGVPIFDGLTPSELARIRTAATEKMLAPGAVLVAEGDPGDALYVVLEGELAVTKRAGPGEMTLNRVGPGAVQGEIAVLSGGPRRATVRAITPVRALRLGRDDLFDVLAREPRILRSLVGTVARRLWGMEAAVQEQERLASLGTLAAGLAHEINNPAAAARSSVRRLDEALDEWDRAATALGAVGAGGGPAAAPLAAELLDTLREEVARRVASPPVVDALEAADRRDALATLLARLGMADPDEPAAALVALGWDGNQLDDLLAPFGGDEARLVVAEWLAAAALVRQLLAEVALAAGRISEIVGAVREYTYLDRAPVQRLDVTTGIENTLVILRSKWKAGVAIRRVYAPDLPPIEAFGSELNQVWTNLIDNAIDAMAGSGELAIDGRRRTGRRRRRGDLRQRPGSPGGAPGPHLRSLLHDEGAWGPAPGLGLYISRSIVERHGGRLDLVAGDPGRTCFRVTLPPRPPGREPPGRHRLTARAPTRSIRPWTVPSVPRPRLRPTLPCARRSRPGPSPSCSPTSRARRASPTISASGWRRAPGPPPRDHPGGARRARRASRCRPRATASSRPSPGPRRPSRPPSQAQRDLAAEAWPPGRRHPGPDGAPHGRRRPRPATARTSATTCTGPPGSRRPPTAARSSCPRRRERSCEDALPPGVTLRDLGEHRLKDLRPEHLAQLVIDGLPADFPTGPLARRAARTTCRPSSPRSSGASRSWRPRWACSRGDSPADAHRSGRHRQDAPRPAAGRGCRRRAPRRHLVRAPRAAARPRPRAADRGPDARRLPASRPSPPSTPSRARSASAACCWSSTTSSR